MRSLKIFITLLLVTLSLSKGIAQYVQPMRYDHYSFTQQANIGVGTVRTTAPSAYLEVGPTSGANKGFLPPRLSTTLRDAISSPAAGLFIYNTTTARYNFYNGIAWADISTSSGVDSLWRTPGVDSIYWLKNGITYKIKDSTGGGVNIYNSDGTLTGDRLVSANNNSFQIDSFSTIGFFGKSANPSSVLTRKNIYTFNSDDNGLDGIFLETHQNGGIGSSRIELKNETVLIDATEKISINTQDSADVIIGRLPTGSSTDSVLVWTAGTGQVKKRNVSSLVSTPTLQQVLTAGSTLTVNNTIDADGNEFIVNNSSRLGLFANTGSYIEVSRDIVLQSIGGNTTIINVRVDSLEIKPANGISNIDSLRSATIADTLYKKPMTWDTRNGRWEYLTQWPQQKINLVFGAGSGADADTTAFTTSALYGDYYLVSDTFKVTSVRVVMQGTSPDVTIKIFYNDSLNVEAGATVLNSSGNQVTNTTTGTNITSFTNSEIPAGNYIWIKTSTVAVKPKYLSVQINGYIK